MFSFEKSTPYDAVPEDVQEDEGLIEHAISDRSFDSPRKITLFIILGSFLLGITVNQLLSLGSASWAHKNDDHHPGKLVNLPIEPVEFEWNQTFVDLPSNLTDTAWHALIPGRGNLHGKAVITNPRAWGLEPGIPTSPDSETYGVSMFHQLHCLISIRDVFYKLLTQHYNPSDYHAPLPGDTVTELYARVKGHTSHCFDYLRQGIQCGGDMTLEGFRADARNGVLGMGTVHGGCRSFDKAREWMVAHQPEELE